MVRIKTWHAGTPNQKRVWRCSAKYEHHTGCTTTHLTDHQIQALFTQATKQLLDQTQQLSDTDLLDEVTKDAFDTTSLES